MFGIQIEQIANKRANKSNIAVGYCLGTTSGSGLYSVVNFYSIMVGTGHSAVYGCSNDRRYPAKYVIKDHIRVYMYSTV